LSLQQDGSHPSWTPPQGRRGFDQNDKEARRSKVTRPLFATGAALLRVLLTTGAAYCGYWLLLVLLGDAVLHLSFIPPIPDTNRLPG